MGHWTSFRRLVTAGIADRYVPGRRFALCCGLLIAAVVAGELACRALGLHTPVLYDTAAYGYRIRPNQDIVRFGNRIHVNAQGLRSESLAPLPAAGVIRVLCIGDSITNGGTVIDQDDTYPYQLQKKLRADAWSVEVLNASAPGWAITNEAGWLKENGTLHSRVVVLTISTIDLFQEFAGPQTVGGHPSFPGHAPALALEELVVRYALPRLLHRPVADPGGQPSAQSLETARENIAHLLGAAEFATRSGSAPVVLFVEQPGGFELSDAFTVLAKTMLFEALEKNRIAYANTRDSVKRGGGALLFRDGLHPNAEGNRVLAQVAAGLLAPVIGETSPTGK